MEEATRSFDAYGNLTNLVTKHYHYPGGVPVIHRTDTEANHYRAPNTTNWLVDLFDSLNPSTVTSVTTSPSETVTRTTKYVPDLVRGGLLEIELEPNSGNSSTHLRRRFRRDIRGRLQEVGDFEFATSTSSVITQNRPYKITSKPAI